MPSPSTPILDNFNRANEGPPPSASWVTPTGPFCAGGLKVISNQCAANTPAFFGMMAAYNTSYGPDCEFYVDIPACLAGSSQIELYIRNGSTQLDSISGQTGYTLLISFYNTGFNDELSLGYADGSAVIGTYHVVPGAGDSFWVQAIGTTIKVFYKPSGGSWSEVISVTDSAYNQSGYTGLMMNDDTLRADNFGGGTIVSGRTGDLSQTLGALSLSADGWLERIGDLAQTLGALTLDAQGEALTYQYPILINVQRITASGPGAIGVDVTGHAISQNVRADSLVVEDGGLLEARGVYYDTITTLGTGQIVPLRSDRGAWDVANYAGRHASDIEGSTWVYHRNPALSGSYTVIDPSVRRILDVASTSLNEVAAILGTLIDDLGLT